MEIENVKDFTKKNLTYLFSSESLNSSALLNDNDTSIDFLKKVYGELKKEKAKLLSLFNHSMDECKTSLIQSQSNFKSFQDECC